MKATKRQRLERKGWKVGDAAEFLDLSPEQVALIDMKIELGKMLRARRVDSHWTQVEFAKKVRSSQSRVAKMESGDPSVSLDLLVKSLLAAGTSRSQLAKAIGG